MGMDVRVKPKNNSQIKYHWSCIFIVRGNIHKWNMKIRSVSDIYTLSQNSIDYLATVFQTLVHPFVIDK